MKSCWLIHNFMTQIIRVYGMFPYNWPKFMVNSGKYSIHGAFGQGFVLGKPAANPMVRHMQTPKEEFKGAVGV